MTATREQILAALSAFVRQRPGLEYGNYASGWRDDEGRRAYFREMRSITRDLHDFRALLAAVSWRSSITAEHLTESFRAYSGRLTLTATPEGGARLEYCTGQYFPTEYRKAACAVLGSALFAYFRACVETEHPRPAASEPDRFNYGDAIRKLARRELGARLQRRWVD